MTWYTDNFYYLHHTHTHSHTVVVIRRRNNSWNVSCKQQASNTVLHDALAGLGYTCDATVDNYAHLALTALQVSDLSKPIINETFLGSVYR